VHPGVLVVVGVSHGDQGWFPEESAMKELADKVAAITGGGTSPCQLARRVRVGQRADCLDQRCLGDGSGGPLYGPKVI
jgi:hypothetical protein